MNTILILAAGLVAGVLAGLGIMVAVKKRQEAQKKAHAQSEADKIISRAKAEAAKIESGAKNRAKDYEVRAKKNVEGDILKQKQKLQSEEKTLNDRRSQFEREITKKSEELENEKRGLGARAEKVEVAEKRMRELEVKAAEKLEELKAKLESVSGLTTDEAKRQLVDSLTEEAQTEAHKKAIQIEEVAKEEAEKKAKRIISLAINRYAGEYVAERAVSVVALPSDEMKGKIIGREGRNIRAIEAACGVDLIVDDTPEAVVISAFDPVRREIARRALDTLIEDGRVHPARIEEIVDKVKTGIFRTIKEDGEKACFDLGITGVHPEIMKLVGSLKYRTSYTQNNYPHSIETGFLAGMMAVEMGLDPKIARRGGLLHDIGKALDHSIEGSHAVIGADFAKKHGETELVCHAIRSHHEDEKPKTAYAHLVAAADALSGARPGARRSMMDSYVQRLEDLESIGNSFDGVLRTFALQAGREIRVLVESGKVTDEQAVMLSRDIAKKIERELTYPGQIRVTVVRETRAVEHAR